VCGEAARGVVESMNGPRFVYDELVGHGWEVLVADAQKVKGLASPACKTDKIDSRVLGELSFRDLVPAIWRPTARREGMERMREPSSGDASAESQLLSHDADEHRREVQE
jgi:hypothetical protein